MKMGRLSAKKTKVKRDKEDRMEKNSWGGERDRLGSREKVTQRWEGGRKGNGGKSRKMKKKNDKMK